MKGHKSASDSDQAGKDHWLRRTNRRAIPSDVMVVAMVTETAKRQEFLQAERVGASMDRKMVAMGCSWHRIESGAVTRSGELLPCTREDWISAMVARTRGGRTLTVYTLGLRELLDVLHVYDLLDNGVMTLGAKRQRPDDGAKFAKGRAWRGVIILENPPNIFEARLKETGGIVRMLDLRNWGVDEYADLCDKPATNPACVGRGKLAGIDGRHVVHGRLACLARWAGWYIDMVINNDLGSCCNTAASQAWHSYRRRFLDARLLVHRDNDCLAIERASYFPGRCECVRLGKVRGLMAPVEPHQTESADTEKIYHLDVNGMYPAIARLNPMPCRLLGMFRSQEEIMEIIDNESYGLIADVTLETNDQLYPWRVRENADAKAWSQHLWDRHQVAREQFTMLADGEVIWPVGIFRTVLCGPELTTARLNGHVKKYHQAAAYEMDMPFRRWVDTMSMAGQITKQKYPAGFVRTIKRILVGLFGKFGQWVYDWQVLEKYVNDQRWEWWQEVVDGCEGVISHRTMGGVTERFCGRKDHPESMPAIAAWINSLGRMYLAHLILSCGRGQVYYYDTDSVFCSTAGFDNLQRAGFRIGAGLGELKVVGEHDLVELHGIRHYVADGKVTCAGLSPEWISRSMSEVFAAKEIPLKFELSAGNKPAPKLRVEKVRLRKPYRHGNVMPDRTVQPWRL